MCLSNDRGRPWREGQVWVTAQPQSHCAVHPRPDKSPGVLNDIIKQNSAVCVSSKADRFSAAHHFIVNWITLGWSLLRSLRVHEAEAQRG